MAEKLSPLPAVLLSIFRVWTELSSGGAPEGAAQLLHLSTRSAQHSIVQIWSGGSGERLPLTQPRAAVALNGSRKQGLPHTSWVFLFLCHSSRMCLIWASVSLTPPPPPFLPFSPHPFLSLSPSRGSEWLGGRVRLQLWGRLERLYFDCFSQPERHSAEEEEGEGAAIYSY